jgi:hypothetical protein
MWSFPVWPFGSRTCSFTRFGFAGVCVKSGDFDMALKFKLSFFCHLLDTYLSPFQEKMQAKPLILCEAQSAFQTMNGFK